MAPRRLARLQLLGQPLPPMRAAEGGSEVVGLQQKRAHILPDEVVEGTTRDIAGCAALALRAA
jgi:hypothetical protein